jgi:hypothetical protein
MKAKYLISFFAVFWVGLALAGTGIVGGHYKSVSDHGKNIYDLVIKLGTIEWTGLAGVEKGMSEVNPSQLTHLGDAIDVIQWIGKKKTFNTVIIDHKNMEYVYSGIDSKKETTLEKGKIEEIG